MDLISKCKYPKFFAVFIKIFTFRINLVKIFAFAGNPEHNGAVFADHRHYWQSVPRSNLEIGLIVTWSHFDGTGPEFRVNWLVRDDRNERHFPEAFSEWMNLRESNFLFCKLDIMLAYCSTCSLLIKVTTLIISRQIRCDAKLEQLPAF